MRRWGSGTLRAGYFKVGTRRDLPQARKRYYTDRKYLKSSDCHDRIANTKAKPTAPGTDLLPVLTLMTPFVAFPTSGLIHVLRVKRDTLHRPICRTRVLPVVALARETQPGVHVVSTIQLTIDIELHGGGSRGVVVTTRTVPLFDVPFGVLCTGIIVTAEFIPAIDIPHAIENARRIVVAVDCCVVRDCVVVLGHVGHIKAGPLRYVIRCFERRETCASVAQRV